MVNITLSVPEDLKSKLDKHPEFNWSEVARQAFREKLSKLEMLEQFSSKFKLSDKDLKELSDNINLAVSKRFMGAK